MVKDGFEPRRVDVHRKSGGGLDSCCWRLLAYKLVNAPVPLIIPSHRVVSTAETYADGGRLSLGNAHARSRACSSAWRRLEKRLGPKPKDSVAPSGTQVNRHLCIRTSKLILTAAGLKSVRIVAAVFASASAGCLNAGVPRGPDEPDGARAVALGRAVGSYATGGKNEAGGKRARSGSSS